MESLTVPAEVCAQATAAGIIAYTLPSGASYIVIQDAQGYHAFVNRCPHRHLPLDRNGHFTISAENRLLLCSNHGARFDLQSGRCVAGPCVGKTLQAITVLAE
jgi:nitrite reductase/ring-hydroxylating ferredoxin subunit